MVGVLEGRRAGGGGAGRSVPEDRYRRRAARPRDAGGAAHLPDVDPVVRSDSLMLQLALVRSGVGVALVPEPSLRHYGLVPVGTGAAPRDDPGWPHDEQFLVTHRALRLVPRVRVVWDLLAERVGRRLGRA